MISTNPFPLLGNEKLKMISISFILGINTGFAVNRYSEPEEWVRIVGEDLRLDTAQITADILSPDLPSSYRIRQIAKINKACAKYGVNISSAFTGAFTRVNHLAHPDEEVRRHWISWFKRFIEQSADLGAVALGGHFGIFTLRENRDPVIRKIRLQQNIDGWHEIADYAKNKGMKHMLWEPMSISREQGDTIDAARLLQDQVSFNAPIPFKICLDVDHGNLASDNPADTDPCAWIRAFKVDTAQIHLKQSSLDKRSNGPFTNEFNKKGRIHADKIIDTLISSGYSKIELLLELSFREREPSDSTVIEQLKQSVDYWRGHL